MMDQRFPDHPHKNALTSPDGTSAHNRWARPSSTDPAAASPGDSAVGADPAASSGAAHPVQPSAFAAPVHEPLAEPAVQASGHFESGQSIGSGPFEPRQPVGSAQAVGSAQPVGFPRSFEPAPAKGTSAQVLRVPESDPTPAYRRKERRAVWVLLLIIALLAGLIGGVAIDRVFLAKGKMTVSPAPTIPGIGQSDVGIVASSALQSTVYIQARSETAGNDGTGVVYSGDGIIITNAHVIMAGSEPASSITVVLPDGQSQEAVVVGYTRQYDLAVLRISASDLTAMPLAEDNSAKVGDSVVAVGAPLGLTGTVTTGIVSALERPVRAGTGTESSYINALQTDAAINPGNSGGPLVNMEGELVGINSAIKQPYNSNGQAVGPVGLGFAIPVGQVKYTVEEILQQGYATYPVMGILLSAQDASEGALITSSDDATPAVTPGGPADLAGLKEGDLIVAVNGKPIRSVTEFVVYLGSLKPGETVDIEVEREGETISATLTLSSRRAN